MNATQLPPILIIAPNRLGDAILSTGIIETIRNRNPDTRLIIAAGPVSAPIYTHLPNLDRIIIVQKRSWHRHWLDLWRALPERNLTALVDFRASLFYLTVRAHHRYRSAPKKHARTNQPPIHKVHEYAAMIGLNPNSTETPPAPCIWSDEYAQQKATHLLPDGIRTLVLAPTTHWGGKCWPGERFIELAKCLLGKGGILEDATLLVAGGKGEGAAFRQSVLAEAIGSDRPIFCSFGQFDLIELAELFRRATLFIGNDSGLMHLAAASDIPVIGLFGPSDARIYGPYGTRSRVIRTRETFDEIINKPDYDHRSHKSHMHSITVDQIVHCATRLLGAQA